MRWLPIVLMAGCLLPTQTTVLNGKCVKSSDPLATNVLVGQMGTVQVGLDYQCGQGPVHASGVTVSVTDPDGGVVEHSESDFSTLWADSIKVTFLPARPGIYRIQADFTGTASVQLDVAAVVWRTDAPRVVPWSPTTQCAQLDVTDQGTVVCMRHANFGKIDLVTLRGDQLSALAFALEHDVLWRLWQSDGETRLDRMIDDGTMFQTTHTVSQATLSAPLAPQGGDVWLYDGALVRAHPELDGGLSLTHAPVPLRPDALAPEPDGGVLVFSTQQDLNHPSLIQVPGSAIVFGGPGSTFLEGAAADTLYVQQVANFGDNTDHTGQFNVAAFRGSATASAPFPMNATVKTADLLMGPSPPIIPLIAVPYGPGPYRPPPGPQTLPVFDGTTVTLETFDVGSGYDEIRFATARHAFALSFDGASMKIFDR